MTVSDAVTAYLAVRDARRANQVGRPQRSDASYKLTRHVLEDARLPAVRLAELKERDLRAWQQRLVRSEAASRQRIVNDLKAALNAAYEANREILPPDLPTTIKYGLKVEASGTSIAMARNNQILTDDQVRGVVAAAIAIDEDFGHLVVLLAATGARFSQLVRMTVADVQAGQSRVMIPQSFKGRKHSLQYIRVQVGEDTLSAIAPIIRNRPDSDRLLGRWRHRQIGPMAWERIDQGPWTAPSEMSRLLRRAVIPIVEVAA